MVRSPTSDSASRVIVTFSNGLSSHLRGYIRYMGVRKRAAWVYIWSENPQW